MPTRLIDLPRRKRDQTAVVKRSQISVFKVVSGPCERIKRPKGIEKQYIVSCLRMGVRFRLAFRQVQLERVQMICMPQNTHEMRGHILCILFYWWYLECNQALCLITNIVSPKNLRLRSRHAVQMRSLWSRVGLQEQTPHGRIQGRLGDASVDGWMMLWR